MISEEEPQPPAAQSDRLSFEAVRRPPPGPFLIFPDQGPRIVDVRGLDRLQASPPEGARLVSGEELFAALIAIPEGIRPCSSFLCHAQRFSEDDFATMHPKGFLLITRYGTAPCELKIKVMSEGLDSGGSDQSGALLALDGFLIQAVDSRTLHRWLRAGRASLP